MRKSTPTQGELQLSFLGIQTVTSLLCDGTLKSNWHTGSQKAFVIGPVYMEKSRTWWEGHALYTATLGERTFYTLL